MELVYGEPLVVPGDFIPTTTFDLDHATFLEQVKEKTKTLVPKAPSCHGTSPSQPCPELAQCDYVFVRRDGLRTPLQTLLGLSV